MSPRKSLFLIALLTMLAGAACDDEFTEPNPAYRKYEKADALAPSAASWKAVCQWKTPCSQQEAPDGGIEGK